MTRRARLRWLGEQAGWLVGTLLAVALAALLLPLVPLLRALAAFERWLDGEPQ